jgi:hypothetical protein
MVNYEEAVKKPFTDLGKLFLGVVLSAFPVLNWISQGFVLECSGVGKNRPSRKMPAWKNFKDLIIKGFLSYLVIFVYAIPAILVFSVSVGYAFASLFPTFVGMIPEGMSSGASGAGMAQMFSQNWMQLLPTLFSASIVLIPMIALGIILLLLAVYMSPIAILNYIKSRKFEKAFDLGFVMKKTFTVKYLFAWLMAILIALVIKSVLTIWLGTWIGSAAAIFISSTIAFSLFGQVFREK